MCVLPQPGALFLTSQLPKVLQTWCVLYVLTSKCASRHRREHFLNCSTSKNAFRTSRIFRILTSQCASGTVARIFWSPSTHRFSEPTTFRPSGTTKPSWEKQRVLQLLHALRSSFRTLSSLPLPTTVATSFNQLAPLFIAFILTGCAPTVFDYWNLHDTPILGTVPPKKTGNSESLRGFSWGTTRRRDSTSQKRCDILWPKQTLAAWTGTSWHVHGLFIHVHSWLFYNCFLLQVFWTQLFGHT